MRRLIEQRLARRRAELDPRDRFLANVVGPVSPELLELIDTPSQQAAVLVPLIDRPTGLCVFLTERARHLKHHPGQISFPGGRLEHPEEGVTVAALREADEEVGLKPTDVTVVGSLPPHVTGTGFSVTPVIGFVADRFEPRLDPAEVQSAFEVPLAFFMDPENAVQLFRERFGSRIRMPEFHYQGRRIWGATAAMMLSFIEILND